MKKIFADTYYWIALLNDRDQGHASAQAISQSIQQDTIVTTQEVLAEVLTHFSAYGPPMRQSAAAFVRSIMADPTIEVRPQSDQSFVGGLAFYESRPDKEYSFIPLRKGGTCAQRQRRRFVPSCEGSPMSLANGDAMSSDANEGHMSPLAKGGYRRVLRVRLCHLP
jgi:predicted nucleic acid-binding protein